MSAEIALDFSKEEVADIIKAIVVSYTPESKSFLDGNDFEALGMAVFNEYLTNAIKVGMQIDLNSLDKNVDKSV